MTVKLFQVIKNGSLWAVYAVSANDPNDRELVRMTDDERFAIEVAETLNRIAATYEVESDEADEVDLSEELGMFDQPRRRFRPDLD